MKFYVFVGFVITTCLARPDVSHLSNVYLPSQSNNIASISIAARANNVDEGAPGVVLVTPKGESGSTEATVDSTTAGNDKVGTTNTDSAPEYSIDESTTTNAPDNSNNAPDFTSAPPSSSGNAPSSGSGDAPSSGYGYAPSSGAPTSGSDAPSSGAPSPGSNDAPSSGAPSSGSGDEPSSGSPTSGSDDAPSSGAPSSSSGDAPSSGSADNELTPQARFNPPSGGDDFSIFQAASNTAPLKHLPTGSYLPGSGAKIDGSETSGGDGSYLGLPGGSSGQQGGSDKSVYFFAAPDDESESRLRINILPSNQASTRVIFIKAPSYAPPIPEVISTPSETDEKTVIYVLSKKPDAASPISIPSSTLTRQSKPQIFFIKYGSRTEAEKAIANGLKGSIVGSSIQDLQNAQSFIKAIQGQAGGGTKGGSKFGPAGQSGPYL